MGAKWNATLKLWYIPEALFKDNYQNVEILMEKWFNEETASKALSKKKHSTTEFKQSRPRMETRVKAFLNLVKQ